MDAKNIYLYIIVFLLSITLTACEEEDFGADGKVGDNEAWATLNFGHADFDKVDVTSRATLSDLTESRVENLFVYVFDSTGKRLCSHYYDYNNRVDELPNTAGHYWTVSNRTSSNSNDTEGEVMIKAPTLEGGSVYIIANLNADQLNISPDQLNTIEQLSELKSLTVTLNQEITSRTGCFLMTGSADGVSIDDKGNITKNKTSLRIPLVRLDAKVTVKVAIGNSTQANQRMKNFVPESWQVLRLPKGTQLIDTGTDADFAGYFDSEEKYFEKMTDGVNEFSFYMLENMENTQGISTYNQRDERSKKGDGSYDMSAPMWKYASENATYLKIKGKVQMEVDTDDETAMQYLEADVTYIVHLGNFGDSKGGGNYNDFTIDRNTHYTYTITIKGVNNIEIEVTDNKENQSGAMGHVYKSREEIYTFDAHYGQRVFSIDVESILDKTVTWYVKTPFSEGTPGMESGTEIPNLDYKWAWFMVNKTNSNGSYSTNNQWFPGDRYFAENLDDTDKLMNVVEFVQFIKDEKAKYENATEANKGTASAFRKDANGRYCMYVTVFVDEYFYESNPLNIMDQPQDLWKRFVNKPNRIMHILCDSKISKDGDSSLTSSVITIRQRSIQTPYNISNGGLMTAWGCESEDEFLKSQLYFYDSSETMTASDNGSRNLGDVGVTSEKNGLYNTVRILGINPGVTLWSDYLDYDRDNDYSATINRNTITTYFLKNDKAALRYAILMRNRDNNGNKKIDLDEIRWYLGTMNQLYDLYIGQLGLNSDAALYTAEMAALPNEKYTTGPYSGASKWRNHVVCSTWTGGNGSDGQIQVLWAEEGLSTSGYFERWEKFAPFSARCVRNLGLPVPTKSIEGVEGVDYPVSLVQVSNQGGNVYRFDLTNVNEKSLRYFTSRELELGNEQSEMARVYSGFETGQLVTRTQVGGSNNYGNYTSLKDALESGVSTGCDIANGYRVPNVREGALMALYCPSDFWNNQYTMVSTWYSLGDRATGGNGYDAGYYSWQFSYKYGTVGRADVNTIRSVRDWRP